MRALVGLCNELRRKAIASFELHEVFEAEITAPGKILTTFGSTES
jgi:hypothetical protein